MTPLDIAVAEFSIFARFLNLPKNIGKIVRSFPGFHEFYSFVSCNMASGNVIISQTSISNCSESERVHLMACEIEHDGEAMVECYFDTTVRQEDSSLEVQNGVKGNDLI